MNKKQVERMRRREDMRLLREANACAFKDGEHGRERGSLAAVVGFEPSKEGTKTTWRGRPCIG